MVNTLTEIPKDYLEAFTAVLLKIQVFWGVRLLLGKAFPVLQNIVLPLYSGSSSPKSDFLTHNMKGIQNVGNYVPATQRNIPEQLDLEDTKSALNSASSLFYFPLRVWFL